MNPVSREEINSILYPNRSDREFYVKQIVVKTTAVALSVFASSFMGSSVALVATGGLLLSFVLAGRFNKEMHKDLAVLAIGVSLAVLTLFSANCAIRNMTGFVYETSCFLNITTLPALIDRLFILSASMGIALSFIDRSADIAYKLLTDKIARDQLATYLPASFSVALQKSLGLFLSLFLPLPLFITYIDEEKTSADESKYAFEALISLRKILQQLATDGNYEKVESWLNEQMKALEQLVEIQPISEKTTKLFMKKRAEILTALHQLKLVQWSNNSRLNFVNRKDLKISALTSRVLTHWQNDEEWASIDALALKPNEWEKIAAELGVPYNEELGISLSLMGLETVKDLRHYQIITEVGNELNEEIVEELKEFIQKYKQNSGEVISRNAIYNLLRGGGTETNRTPFERMMQKILAIAFRMFQCALLVAPLIIAPKTTLAGAVSAVVFKNFHDKLRKAFHNTGAASWYSRLLSLIYGLVAQRALFSNTPFATFSRRNFEASSLMGKFRMMGFELGVNSLSSWGPISILMVFCKTLGVKVSFQSSPPMSLGSRNYQIILWSELQHIGHHIGFFMQGMALGNECIDLASQAYRRLQQSLRFDGVVPV